MSKAKFILKNPRTGSIKAAPVGFSWTVLLFGFLVPVYRKDWLWAILMLILEIPTFGLASVPFAFFYNKIYIKSLFRRGYTYFSSQGRIERKVVNSYLAFQNKIFNKAFADAAE